MDRLWTPWRYAYFTKQHPDNRKGVPKELASFPGDHGSVFLNLIGSVQWAAQSGFCSQTAAEKAAGVLLQGKHHFICLNAYPYSSGHVMIVPYQQVASLAELNEESSAEMMLLAQRMERALRITYQPEGINLGINMGEAAGAGVAEHLHMHLLPRWFGDHNFMSVIGETRILPETLDITWRRLREALEVPID